MQKLTFKNELGEVVLGNDAPIWLIDVQGITGLGVKIQSQKAPFQNGSDHIEQNFQNRYIRLEGIILSPDCTYDTLNEQKINLQKIFNPEIESELIYTNETYTKKIKVWCEAAPTFFQEDKTRRSQRFLVSLEANEPFWLDENISGELMSLVLPAFEFPNDELEFDEFIEFSVEGNNRSCINNEGHVSTPVRIEFEGPAVNPKIINETTGEFIQVNVTLNAEERLTITTGFGDKRVLFDDGSGDLVNKMGFISNDTTFFQLQRGDNEISYQADVGTTTAEVIIQWYNQYLGL